MPVGATRKNQRQSREKTKNTKNKQKQLSWPEGGDCSSAGLEKRQNGEIAGLERGRVMDPRTSASANTNLTRRKSPSQVSML